MVLFLTFKLRFRALRLSFSPPVALNYNFGFVMACPFESVSGDSPDLGPKVRFGLRFPGLGVGEGLRPSSKEV